MMHAKHAKGTDDYFPFTSKRFATNPFTTRGESTDWDRVKHKFQPVRTRASHRRYSSLFCLPD